MWSAFLLLTILFGTLALYVPTLAPGLLWGGEDFATSQTMAYLLEIQLPGGIFGHSLWVVLAHPFTRLPVREAAWQVNLAYVGLAPGAAAGNRERGNN